MILRCADCFLLHLLATPGKRSFPKDLLPIYTRDVACIIIQRKWRAILMRQFLRALVRAQHDEVWDPVKGRFNYYHRESEVLHQEKPKLLGTCCLLGCLWVCMRYSYAAVFVRAVCRVLHIVWYVYGVHRMFSSAGSAKVSFQWPVAHFGISQLDNFSSL